MFNYRKECRICLAMHSFIYIGCFMVTGSFFFAQGLVELSFSRRKSTHAIYGRTTSIVIITTMKNLLCQLGD